MIRRLREAIARILAYAWWLHSEDIDDPEVHCLSKEMASALGVKPFKKIKLCRKLHAVNAVVVGLRCSSLVITEFLLKYLSKDEVKAVFLHEYSHCKLRHQIKLLATSMMLLAGLSVLMAVATMAVDSVLVAVPMLIASYLLVALVVRALTRRFELEADRLAASKLGRPEVYISLLRKTGLGYARASRIKALFAAHPTVDERVNHVLKCLG